MSQMGKPTILYTGTNPESYSEKGIVRHHPMIEIVALSDFTTIDKEIDKIQEYNWLIFTSKYAVTIFLADY